MNAEEKQKEIEKIISVCNEHIIQYNINKLDFIEKDTGLNIQHIGNYYELIVIQENDQLKIDDFYSIFTTTYYAEEILHFKDKAYFKETGEKIVGRVIINNINNTKSFSYFSNNYQHANNTKKLKLAKPQTINILTHKNPMICLWNENKFKLFNYLEKHKYILNKQIDDKIIMCLDTKNKSLAQVDKDILKYFNSKNKEAKLSRYMNMFGLNWTGNDKKCCIEVDIKTFKRYYLPFTKLNSSNESYEKNVKQLKKLEDLYKLPLPNNKEEDNVLKEKMREILFPKFFLLKFLQQSYIDYHKNNN